MVDFRYKLYSFLRSFGLDAQVLHLSCLESSQESLQTWWERVGYLTQKLAQASDRIALNLQSPQLDIAEQNEVRHLISGQRQELTIQSFDLNDLEIPTSIKQELDPKVVFLWFWRFLPEMLALQHRRYGLIYPADIVLPDCPVHSFASTVSAIAGALCSEGQEQSQKRPHILLFTFSPVQEFIKSSRKMLDFWSGSYLLHYLSAWLCQYVAQILGPDAIITPSLWGQEIIDAFILGERPSFEEDYQRLIGDCPIAKFQNQDSISLSTAGFPNFIAILVPGREAATQLSQELTDELRKKWCELGEQVRQCIKDQVRVHIAPERIDRLWSRIQPDFLGQDATLLLQELEELRKGSSWSWRELWTSQLENTWEVFATAIPLGHPESPFNLQSVDRTFQAWISQQNDIAQARQPIPTEAEQMTCAEMNVGTWWGATQAQAGRLIQVAKNTRTWKVPAAPGFRSTLSGQFSAMHPRSQYHGKFREGGGVPESSLRLFWPVMAEAFPGLFNGSEQLNAIELTKRMAWKHGGIYNSFQAPDLLDTEASTPEDDVDYDGMIRFPNLRSIAVARFACDAPHIVRRYRQQLVQAFKSRFSSEQYHQLHRVIARRSNVPKADRVLNPSCNGVMFSAKWLAEDLDLTQSETEELRQVVAGAHQACQFGDGSPSDWWALVLADGDSMGNYVSGRSLKPYKDYIPDRIEARLRQISPDWVDLLDHTHKRMGPATHVGLNRALLDFSNRIVPYLTEQRFCGRVIYSGGDDVMAMLPIEDVPGFLLSLRAAWCGGEDPMPEDPQICFRSQGGYWEPQVQSDSAAALLPNRPLFTMGEGATMSVAIAVVHKSVPLPTVLETIWDAEKNRAKKLARAQNTGGGLGTQPKDGVCFRVLFGSGNQLEALMKGDLLPLWWRFMQAAIAQDWSPILHRLAEVLPKHGVFTREDRLFERAAGIVLNRRDRKVDDTAQAALLEWIAAWEQWAYDANPQHQQVGAELDGTQARLAASVLGTQPEDLSQILRFSAFWLDKIEQRRRWREGS